jgi:hypothetical protein
VVGAAEITWTVHMPDVTLPGLEHSIAQHWLSYAALNGGAVV